MKIGVSSYSFSKHIKATGCDLFSVCNLSKEMGFDAIEFTEFGSQLSTEEKLELAARLREHCATLELPINDYTIGANFLAEDPDAEVARVKQAVDVAEALGVTIMRHDVTFALPKKPLYNYRTAIAEMAPRIREVTEYAATKGIRTCTENHGFIFQAPERVEELILAVNHENYGWLCDIGNFLCADADPVHAVAIAAPYTFHVHVKDFLRKPGTEYKPKGSWITTAGGNYLRGTVIGHGCVPIGNCINALKRAGYDGLLSVEFEGDEENLDAIKNGLLYLRQLI